MTARRHRWRNLEGGLAPLFCLLLALAAPTPAHEGAPGGETPAAPAPPLAPGYGQLGFEAPLPGSYELPVVKPAADAVLVDTSGRERHLHEVFGDRVAVLSFIYTHCPDVNGCPLATFVLRRLKRAIEADPALASRVVLVSVSFDPEHDTPEALARYAEPLAGGTVPWVFLTARSRQALEPLLAAYGQSVIDLGEGRISHILRVFLIDPQHRIRNIYTPSFLHPDLVLADIRTVLADGGAAGASALPRAERDAAGRLLARARARHLGLPPVPGLDAVTVEQVALGRKLFYDRRLSANFTMSCAMCHIPGQGFTSHETATAIGIEGRTVRRNAPTVLDVGFLGRLFHDGREFALEHQIWGPLLAANEMGNASPGLVLERLAMLDDYRQRFERAFPGTGLTMETLGAALAAYQRTLVSGGSRFDRWRYGGEQTLDEQEQAGYRLFVGRAGCARCHTVGEEAALFTDQAFHNTGVGFRRSMAAPAPRQPVRLAPGVTVALDRDVVRSVGEPPPADLGLYEITGDPADRWRYRTPSLRNVALTAPYMHDGSLATLTDVVAFYDRGGHRAVDGHVNETLSPLIRPLGLTAAERAALVAFLRSLTGDVAPLVADGERAPVGDITEDDLARLRRWLAGR